MSVSAIACFFRSFILLNPNLTKIWWRDFFTVGSRECCSRSTTCLKYTLLLLLLVPSRGPPSFLLTSDYPSSRYPRRCSPNDIKEKAWDLISSSAYERFEIVLCTSADSLGSVLGCTEAFDFGSFLSFLFSEKVRVLEVKRMLWGCISFCLSRVRNWAESRELYADWDAIERYAISESPNLCWKIRLLRSFSMRSVGDRTLAQSAKSRNLIVGSPKNCSFLEISFSSYLALFSVSWRYS